MTKNEKIQWFIKDEIRRICPKNYKGLTTEAVRPFISPNVPTPRIRMALRSLREE